MQREQSRARQRIGTSEEADATAVEYGQQSLIAPEVERRTMKKAPAAVTMGVMNTTCWRCHLGLLPGDVFRERVAEEGEGRCCICADLVRVHVDRDGAATTGTRHLATVVLRRNVTNKLDDACGDVLSSVASLCMAAARRPRSTIE